MIGKVFGRLTVLDKAERNSHYQKYYRCRCECGNIKDIRVDCLTNGNTISCGCLRSPNRVGQRYGKVLVLEKIPKAIYGDRVGWRCKCDCGRIYETDTYILQRIKSCGKCSRRRVPLLVVGDINRLYWNKITHRARKNGLEFSLTPEDIWQLFLKQDRKCALTNLPLDLGISDGRKIRDMTASLDRIDSSKGYTIDNIQWLHKDVNYMKNSYQQEYFLQICQMIVDNNAKNLNT